MIEVLLDLATLQAGSAAVCECFRRVLAQWGSRIKLAVIDHVTSNPTVHLPVAQIAALCRASDIKGSSPARPSLLPAAGIQPAAHGINQACAYSTNVKHKVRTSVDDHSAIAGCAVCVDGAHAVGAVPLDVPSLGVQYYTSNLHKWACCPKSAAFLWVAASEQPTMVPLVTSHGYKRVRTLTSSQDSANCNRKAPNHFHLLLSSSSTEKILSSLRTYNSTSAAGRRCVSFFPRYRSALHCMLPACSLLCQRAQQTQM